MTWDLTDHGDDIAALRDRTPSDTGPLSDDELGRHLAADLLEAHDATGISLDHWIAAREFVERAIGHEITPNRA